jgi:hypothetical protein
MVTTVLNIQVLLPQSYAGMQYKNTRIGNIGAESLGSIRELYLHGI